MPKLNEQERDEFLAKLGVIMNIATVGGDGEDRRDGESRPLFCSAKCETRTGSWTGPVDVAPAAHSKRTPEQTV